MPLINCEINLFLTWTNKCVSSNASPQVFEITDTNLYMPVVAIV